MTTGGLPSSVRQPLGVSAIAAPVVAQSSVAMRVSPGLHAFMSIAAHGVAYFEIHGLSVYYINESQPLAVRQSERQLQRFIRLPGYRLAEERSLSASKFQSTKKSGSRSLLPGVTAY
jgi:hypothetical protein